MLRQHVGRGRGQRRAGRVDDRDAAGSGSGGRMQRRDDIGARSRLRDGEHQGMPQIELGAVAPKDGGIDAVTRPHAMPNRLAA